VKKLTGTDFDLFELLHRTQESLVKGLNFVELPEGLSYSDETAGTPQTPKKKVGRPRKTQTGTS